MTLLKRRIINYRTLISDISLRGRIDGWEAARQAGDFRRPKRNGPSRGKAEADISSDAAGGPWHPVADTKLWQRHSFPAALIKPGAFCTPSPSKIMQQAEQGIVPARPQQRSKAAFTGALPRERNNSYAVVFSSEGRLNSANK